MKMKNGIRKEEVQRKLASTYQNNTKLINWIGIAVAGIVVLLIIRRVIMIKRINALTSSVLHAQALIADQGGQIVQASVPADVKSVIGTDQKGEIITKWDEKTENKIELKEAKQDLKFESKLAKHPKKWIECEDGEIRKVGLLRRITGNREKSCN